MTRSSVLMVLALAACSGAPETPRQRESDPELVANEERLRREDLKRRDFMAVMIRLDQALESYVQAVARQGEPRADAQARKLEKLVRDTVLDTGAARSRTAPPGGRGDTYQRLLAQASDNSQPDFQGIALAALGFAGSEEVLPTILQGALLSDPDVVDRAVLGLAVLRSPRTPPNILAAIIERPGHPEDGRTQAAWALYRVQTAVEDQTEIAALWVRYLTDVRDRVPTGVIVTALRGLGQTLDRGHGALLGSFLSHPVPRVRMAAAVAIGRVNAQEQWQALLALLGPRETVQNVRLHARLALAALAGNQDYGYDVAAWRKVFDRGP